MVTLIGSLAAILTASCWLPQVVKTFRLGTADDFAWPYLAMLLVGVSAWTAYGFLRNDAPIYLCNIVTLSLVLVVAGTKLRSTRVRLRAAEERVAMVIEGTERPAGTALGQSAGTSGVVD